MRVRELCGKDVERLRELHAASGFAYDFPDLNRREFTILRCLVDESDAVVQAVLVRNTCELFFIGDSLWRTPKWRFESFRLLHEHIRIACHDYGYTDAHAWIPPQLAKSFTRRLMRGFGWCLNPWACLSRTTETIKG